MRNKANWLGHILIFIFVPLFSFASLFGGTTNELKIGSIKLQGNEFLNRSQILNILNTGPGEPFRKDSLEEGIEQLLNFYGDNGYPFCKIKPRNFSLGGGDQINFTLEIQEGPSITVDSLRIVGNQNTKRKIILRELGLKLPFKYNRSLIEKALNRLRRLSFLKEVYPPKVVDYTNQGRAILLIKVEERKANLINGVLGYAPENKYITGFLDLSFENFLGMGRKIGVKWNKNKPSSSRLNLKYQEPWAFGLPFTLGGSFQQRQEGGYMQLKISLFAETSPLVNFFWGIGVGWKEVDPDSAGQFSMPKSKSLTEKIGLRYDTRDNPFNPTRGRLYKTSLKLNLRREYPTEHFKPEKEKVYLFKYRVGLENFFKLSESHLLKVGIHGTGIKTSRKTLPTEERLYLGGASSIRGYLNRQFSGRKIAWINSEYHFLISKSSRVLCFVDFGFYENQNTASTKLGYGVGLKTNSQMGNVEINYGLGENDRLLEGKIHLKLENRF